MAESIKYKKPDTFHDAGNVYDSTQQKTQEEINKLASKFDFDFRETTQKPFIFSANVNTNSNRTITFSCGGEGYSTITGLIFTRAAVSAIYVNCGGEGNFTTFTVANIIGTKPYSTAVKGSTFSLIFGTWESCRGILFCHSTAHISMTVS